jgi:formylglycine-generating enzyme required for sulfatase activity/TPR repeat protein
MRGLLAAATLLVLVLAPYDSSAEIKTITEKCHYVWGDNDSRLDARKMCLLDAKRRVLERAGSLVRSEMKIENGRLTSEEVASFAEAVIQIEVTNEKHGMSNGRNFTELRVKAKFDQAEVKRRLEQKATSDIRGDGPNRPPSARPANGAHFTPGMVFRDCVDCPKMVVIPAGSFRMGDLNGGGDKNEKPVHRVTIPRHFAVGKYEVTQAEWRSLMGGNPSNLKGKRNPVENVSWDDAKAFVRKLSAKTGKQYRLLTEAEWEFSARAGTTTKYHWGDRFDVSKANNNPSGTVPVGQYDANAFGLHDMLGNVYEWTEDCWNASYSDAPSNGASRATKNCPLRVVRGGSWDVVDPGHLRAASRYSSLIARRDVYFGFRIARTLPNRPAPQPASLTPPAQSIDPLDETYVVVKTANVRAKPDVRSKKLATLRIGTRVQGTGRTKDGKWLRIAYGGKEAYVWKPLLMTKLAQDEVKRKTEGGGDIYCGYIQTPEDVAECELAARNGDAQAQFEVALAYGMGEVVPKNSKTAVKWLKMAANQNYVSAQQTLGSMYYQGDGVEINYKTALKWLKKGIRDEPDGGTFGYIGLIYSLGGHGVEKSYVKATPWLRKAARLGNVIAQAFLGEKLYKGNGIYRDFSEAYFWLSLAGFENDQEAISVLRENAGSHLSPREIREGDERAKIAYVQQNLINGGYYPGPIDGVLGTATTQAVRDLQFLNKLQITGELTPETMGILSEVNTFFRYGLKNFVKQLRRAELGDTSDQLWMAGFSEDSRLRDDEANNWYRKAAKHGALKALMRLGENIANGRGEKSDSVQAYYFFSLAYVQGEVHDQSIADKALKQRRKLVKRMTPEQIAEAERRAAIQAYYLLSVTINRGQGSTNIVLRGNAEDALKQRRKLVKRMTPEQIAEAERRAAIQAYYLLSVAIDYSQISIVAEVALKQRSELAKRMTPEQIAEAERRAAKQLPPGLCAVPEWTAGINILDCQTRN